MKNITPQEGSILGFVRTHGYIPRGCRKKLGRIALGVATRIIQYRIGKTERYEGDTFTRIERKEGRSWIVIGHTRNDRQKAEAKRIIAACNGFYAGGAGSIPIRSETEV